MKIIDSNFNNHHTVLIIDRNIIENLNNYLKKYSTNKKFIIITQKNIYKIFESSFKKIKSNCNFKIIFINNDESAKSLNSYNNTIKKLIEFNCDRKTTLIAFGGGKFTLEEKKLIEEVGLNENKLIHDVKQITNLINIPTIGIGASVNCDGQVLVTDDILGLTNAKIKFVKKYTNIKKVIKSAVLKFKKEVKSSKYPTKRYSY